MAACHLHCCLYAACVLLALRLAVQTQHDMEASLFVGLEICESFFLALCFITDPPDVTSQTLPSYTPPPARSHPSLPKLEQPHRLMNTTTATTRTPFVYVGSVDQASDFPSRVCLLTWNFQMNLEHGVPPDTTQAPEASMPLSPLLIASRHHTNVLYIAPDLPA